MDINKILDDYEDLSKEECLSNGKKYLSKMFSASKVFVKQSNLDLEIDDLTTIISGISIIALAADGRVDKTEYQLYTELMNTIGLTPNSIDDVRKTATSVLANPDLIDKTIDSAWRLVKFAMRDEAQETFIHYFASMFSYNSSLDSKEVELLEKINALTCGEEESTMKVSDSQSSSFNVKNDEPVKIKRHGASLTKDDYSYYLGVGVEIENPNTSRVASSVLISIIVKDKSGRVLADSENTIDYIDSKSVFYYGDQIYIDRGEPSSYTVSIREYDFVDGPEESTFGQYITGSHYNQEKSRWGSNYEFTGNLTNHSNKKLYVTSHFVFYDSRDNITGGINVYVGNIYGKQETGFDTTICFVGERSKVKMSPSFNFFDLLD